MQPIKTMGFFLGVSLLTSGCGPSGQVGSSYPISEQEPAPQGRWMSGDFHTHTFLTDGSHRQIEVVGNAFDKFGLDWMANSEHGGIFERDEAGASIPAEWRWKSLRDRSFPLVKQLREESKYLRQLLVQGVEWNCPTHEHASVGIVSDEPVAISDFEYQFDAKDQDTSRAAEGMQKVNATHADALAAARWLAEKAPETSYLLFNHPSRKLAYSAADLRAFQDAAPAVCFGLEGIPGHQKEKFRGGYNNGPFTDPTTSVDITYQARTYGGADFMIAQVGGLWDALLSEGRRFFTFGNSDFHSSAADADFWPGEYTRNWIYVRDLPGSEPGLDYADLVAGLRSGNSFVALGDLIQALTFEGRSGTATASMGETLRVKVGASVEVTIRFRSPARNARGDRVLVDHVDLIRGEMVRRALPETPAFRRSTHSAVSVWRRFGEADWTYSGDCGSSADPALCGWHELRVSLPSLTRSTYLRLRGTSLPPSTPGETDAQGNPLMDEASTSDSSNTEEKAWADLWFYSNPIFIEVE